jgi:hypothetical protein
MVNKTIGKSFLYFLCFSLNLSSLAYANPIDPLRDPSQLNTPKDGGKSAMLRTTYRIKGATIAAKNVPLIHRDFPETRSWTNDEIDAWLLDNAAYIDEAQIRIGEANQINSPIPIEKHKSVTAYRPDQYGRARVFEVKSKEKDDQGKPKTVGLFDVKGTGADAPAIGDHKHGLMPLSEALREYGFGELFNRVLANGGRPTQTVSAYAVIDTGFDVNLAPNLRSTNGFTYHPAGMIVRQGHVRSRLPGTNIPKDEAFELEKFLRQYGITSAQTASSLNPRKNKNGDVVAIQGTEPLDESGTRAIVDFGAFISVPDFDRPIVCNDSKTNEVKVLLDPKSEDFVRPDPKLLVPQHIWGTWRHWQRQQDPRDFPVFSTGEHASVWAHDLAQAFRREIRGAKQAAERALQDYEAAKKSMLQAKRDSKVSSETIQYLTEVAANLKVQAEKANAFVSHRIREMQNYVQANIDGRLHDTTEHWKCQASQQQNLSSGEMVAQHPTESVANAQRDDKLVGTTEELESDHRGNNKVNSSVAH